MNEKSLFSLKKSIFEGLGSLAQYYFYYYHSETTVYIPAFYQSENNIF